MFEFIRTEKGWRVFWGVDPLSEARAQEPKAIETVVADAWPEPAREAPVLVTAEAAGLGLMAV
jgi:hypothetical protein